MNSRHAVVLFCMALCCAGARAQSVHYSPVTREVIQARLREYGGKDAERESKLKAMFAEAGCANLNEQAVKGSKLPNLICVLPGSGERTVIVGAHYDHVNEGQGVVDNWSGASLLPSLYEALKPKPRKHTYIFIGFTDEEKGEVGSHFYAHQMTKEQIAATDAMVNMDTLGLAPTQVDGSHSDKELTTALLGLARSMSLPAKVFNIPEEVGSTDSDKFRERKVASISIHSFTQEAFDQHILHSSKDQLSAVRLDDYYDTYKLVGAYLAYLDNLWGEKRTP